MLWILWVAWDRHRGKTLKENMTSCTSFTSLHWVFQSCNICSWLSTVKPNTWLLRRIYAIMWNQWESNYILEMARWWCTFMSFGVPLCHIVWCLLMEFICSFNLFMCASSRELTKPNKEEKKEDDIKPVSFFKLVWMVV